MAQAQQILIVLGMHRSGTSLCAHVASALGWDMADEILRGEDNEKGFWERRELVAFHDRILALLDRKWKSAKHALAFPAGWWCEPAIRAVRDEMVAWLRPRLAASVRFGLKDPRICLLLPVWNEIYATLNLQPRYILCIRSPIQVAQSLATRRDIPSFRDTQIGEHRWLSYMAQAVTNLCDERVCVIPYERWFAEPGANLVALRSFLGLALADPLVDGAIGDIVSPSLWVQRPSPDVHNSAITEEFHQRLLHHTNGESFTKPTAQLAIHCAHFEQFIEPLRQQALQTPVLEAQLATRDRVIAANASEMAQLRAELDRGREEAAAASVAAAGEAAALRAELATKAEAIVAELATLQAELNSERQSAMALAQEITRLNTDLGRDPQRVRPDAPAKSGRRA